MNRFALGEAPTLPKMWEELYRRVNPEALVAEGYTPTGAITLTYKEVNARAHCLAAYLLSKGIRPGDRVALLVDCEPAFLPLDLAVQFTGGVSVVLSTSVRPQVLGRILAHAEPCAVIVAELATYRRLQQPLDAYIQAGHPRELIVATADRDELNEADRATLLDRAIEIGKVYWREQTARVRDAKDAVSEASPSAWLYAHPEAEPTLLTQAQTLATLVSAADALTEVGTTDRILLAAAPSHPLGRLATYLCVGTGVRLLPLRRFRRLKAALKAQRPTVLLTLPRVLSHLLHRIRPRRLFAQYWTRALINSRALADMRTALTPPPLGVRLAHSLARAWLYRPTRRAHLPSLRHLYTLAVGLSPDTANAFTQLELPLHTTLSPLQPPLEQLIALPPVERVGSAVR